MCESGGMAQTVNVIVAAEDRERLLAIAGDRNRPLKHVQRARIILLSAERLPVAEVARRAGVSRPAVWRWQRRNYATHKHPNVLKWLAAHPRWTFHFTPTSASWINAVEGFFSTITRGRIRRGVFKSVVPNSKTPSRATSRRITRRPSPSSGPQRPPPSSKSSINSLYLPNESVH